MNNLILDYLDTVRKLEDYKNSLSPTNCKSSYDYHLRVKCLDEEIEDMYFALRLMGAYREA